MPARIRDAFPCPRTRSSVGSSVTRPNAERIRIRIRMKRLHAGNHPKLPEARYVRRRDRLNVFNARTAIVLVVSLFRVLIAIQRHSNAVIADGVREKLQTAFVQLCDRSVVVGGLPKGL